MDFFFQESEVDLRRFKEVLIPKSYLGICFFKLKASYEGENGTVQSGLRSRGYRYASGCREEIKERAWPNETRSWSREIHRRGLEVERRVSYIYLLDSGVSANFAAFIVGGLLFRFLVEFVF